MSELTGLLTLPFGTVRVLSLDALIEAKAAMDRPRDRIALIELTAIRDRRQAGR
jgi:hypothetical protein